MVFRTSAVRPSIGAGAMCLLAAVMVMSSGGLVLTLLLSAARPSLAQPMSDRARTLLPVDPAAEDEAEDENTDTKDTEAKDSEAKDAEAKDADILKDIDVSKLDWSQLAIDASTLNDRSAAKARSAAPGASDLSWSANDRPNGAALSVKQAVSPFLDTRIGADMTVVRQQPRTMSELLSDNLANGGAEPQSSGTAWAAITAPGAGALWDMTAVEARVDPNQEQTRLGTSLTKTVPLTEQYSLWLQNDYRMTQQGMVPLPSNGARPTRNYETDQTAKLSVFDTGTSVSVGQTMSSSDEKWLRKIGAEQKLLDGVSVSGSVGETGQGATSKSISAGFKRSW